MKRISILDHMKIVKKKNASSKKDEQEELQDLKDTRQLKKKQIVFYDIEPSQKKIKLKTDLENSTNTKNFKDLIRQEQLPTELSQKTRDLINKVQIKHGNRKQKLSQKDKVNLIKQRLESKILEKQKNKILSVHPIKRYFNHLKNVVIEIDQIINLFSIREKKTYLDKMIQIANKTLSDKVTQDNIKQILFIAPNLYNIFWHKIFNKGTYKLVINAALKDKSNEYFPFLKTKDTKERLKYFDKEANKFYESLTNDKNVQDIPLADFPDKPGQIKGKRVKDIIGQIDQKKEESEKKNEVGILQKLQVKGLLKKNNTLQQPLTNREKVSLLRQNLLKKISNNKNKENLNKEDLQEIIIEEQKICSLYLQQTMYKDIIQKLQVKMNVINIFQEFKNYFQNGYMKQQINQVRYQE